MRMVRLARQVKERFLREWQVDERSLNSNSGSVGEEREYGVSDFRVCQKRSKLLLDLQ